MHLGEKQEECNTIRIDMDSWHSGKEREGTTHLGGDEEVGGQGGMEDRSRVGPNPLMCVLEACSC